MTVLGVSVKAVPKPSLAVTLKNPLQTPTFNEEGALSKVSWVAVWVRETKELADVSPVELAVRVTDPTTEVALK